MKRFCCVLLCITVILLLSACSDTDWVIFSQTGNHSAGDWWDYELSNDTVIREMDYAESQLVPVSLAISSTGNLRSSVRGMSLFTGWLTRETISLRNTPTASPIISTKTGTTAYYPNHK